jgi:hypothetical protein
MSNLEKRQVGVGQKIGHVVPGGKEVEATVPVAAKTPVEILESGAKKLLEQKFTLDGALGEGWKERCMGEMKDVFTEEEFAVFLSAKVISLEDAKTSTEKKQLA